MAEDKKDQVIKKIFIVVGAVLLLAWTLLAFGLGTMAAGIENMGGRIAVEALILFVWIGIPAWIGYVIVEEY